MIRKIFLFLLALLLTTNYLLLTPTLAADEKSNAEFATSYDVTYDVGEDGVTSVTEKITLRNLTSQYYATQFKLIIGATQISDVKAADGSGPMEVTTERTGTSTTIGVKFNQQIAGVDKKLDWTLSFKSNDFALREGKVWEISAPKISSTTNLENYNLTIGVPLSFGDPTLISPNPKSQTTNFGKRFLTFDKSQLTQAGVSASFGTIQLFDFDLSYHLENPNLVPVLTNIALPPDSAYQDVIFQRIEPSPMNVAVDGDGNYLAWYRLNRNQKINVKVIGSAKLYSKSKVKNPHLDAELVKKYTASDKYWDSDNPVIKTKLGEILGSNPPANSSEKAKLIHRFVANTLKYDTSRLSSGNIERFGALTALNNADKAVCMEFTDLFIALVRAAGIPARELNGFAYTSNTQLRPLSLTKDILHAWPEYWDENKGWVMADPTWENTTGGVDYFNKLDLNHFVFAIHGLSSEKPIPAGSYKYIGQDSQDVKVNLSETDFIGKPNLNVSIDSQNPILAGFPTKVKVRISNLGNAVYPSQSFVITSEKLNILNDKIQKTGLIPAFGHGDFEFDLRTKSLFDNFSDIILVQVAGRKFTKEVKVKPLVIFQTIPLVLIGVVGLVGAIYLTVLGGFIYRKRFLKSHQSSAVSPQIKEKRKSNKAN